MKSINEGKGTIELSSGQGTEVFDYVTFFLTFQTHKANRLPPMKTATEFLSAMKGHSLKADAFGKLSMDGDRMVLDDQK